MVPFLHVHFREASPTVPITIFHSTCISFCVAVNWIEWKDAQEFSKAHPRRETVSPEMVGMGTALEGMEDPSSVWVVSSNRLKADGMGVEEGRS